MDLTKIEEVQQIFKKHNVIISDSHVVFTNWRHGRDYVDKDRILAHPLDASRLANLLAQQFMSESVEVVVAPAVSGAIFGNRVAEHLSMWNARDTLAIYADKKGDNLVIRRGYDKLVTDKRVLIVEDVLNTGGSARKVVDEVRKFGGIIVGVGAMCNRGRVKSENLNVPKLKTLINITLETWFDEADCPLCKHNIIPINTDVGKGREFLERQKKKLGK